MNPTNSGDLDINQKSPEEQAKTKVLYKCQMLLFNQIRNERDRSYPPSRDREVENSVHETLLSQQCRSQYNFQHVEIFLKSSYLKVLV